MAERRIQRREDTKDQKIAKSGIYFARDCRWDPKGKEELLSEEGK